MPGLVESIKTFLSNSHVGCPTDVTTCRP
jgi:hypothetical protein